MVSADTINFDYGSSFPLPLSQDFAGSSQMSQMSASMIDEYYGSSTNLVLDPGAEEKRGKMLQQQQQQEAIHSQSFSQADRLASAFFNTDDDYKSQDLVMFSQSTAIGDGSELNSQTSNFTQF